MSVSETDAILFYLFPWLDHHIYYGIFRNYRDVWIRYALSLDSNVICVAAIPFNGISVIDRNGPIIGFGTDHTLDYNSCICAVRVAYKSGLRVNDRLAHFICHILEDDVLMLEVPDLILIKHSSIYYSGRILFPGI